MTDQAKRVFMMAVLLGSSGLGLTSGCTRVPPRVQLVAFPPAASNRVGAGASLHLIVMDDRDQRTVGQRGVGAIGSDITLRT